MIWDDDWWNDHKNIVSFTSAIIKMIRYADSYYPSLGETYQAFVIVIGKL